MEDIFHFISQQKINLINEKNLTRKFSKMEAQMLRTEYSVHQIVIFLPESTTMQVFITVLVRNESNKKNEKLKKRTAIN